MNNVHSTIIKTLSLKALNNYGYRILSQLEETGEYVFAKPIGYANLRVIASFDTEVNLEVALMVRGNDGKPMVWSLKKEVYDTTDLDQVTIYTGVVQMISDLEAEIFTGDPVALPENRKYRRDFQENTVLRDSIIYG